MTYAVIRRTPNDTDALPVRCAMFDSRAQAEDYAAERCALCDEHVFDVVFATRADLEAYALRLSVRANQMLSQGLVAQADVCEARALELWERAGDPARAPQHR